MNRRGVLKFGLGVVGVGAGCLSSSESATPITNSPNSETSRRQQDPGPTPNPPEKRDTPTPTPKYEPLDTEIPGRLLGVEIDGLGVSAQFAKIQNGRFHLRLRVKNTDAGNPSNVQAPCTLFDGDSELKTALGTVSRLSEGETGNLDVIATEQVDSITFYEVSVVPG